MKKGWFAFAEHDALTSAGINADRRGAYGADLHPAAFFRVRLGSTVLYATWLLVALRLLVPLSLPNPPHERVPSHPVGGRARPVADQLRTRFIDTAIHLARADDRGFSPLGELGAQTSYGHTGKWVLLATRAWGWARRASWYGGTSAFACACGATA